MFKKNTTQWDQATKLHGLANLVGFYGLWNTIITEVQQITWSSSGTKKRKKNSKQNKRKLSMFQFQTHYQEPRRKKSVWDPISKPLSLFLHLPIIVIPKNLEQNFPQKNRYFPKNLEQPQKSFANQVVMEGGVRPKPSRNCQFCAGEVFGTIWVFSFIA